MCVVIRRRQTIKRLSRALASQGEPATGAHNQVVQQSARAAGLENVSIAAGAAEELDFKPESFDAVVCRLGLMLFAEPARALQAVRRVLRPGGRAAFVVFSSPEANRFMVGSALILLQHAGKEPPPPGAPGPFALSAPGALTGILEAAGFEDVEQRVVQVDARTTSADEALAMMQEAFGAYRAILADSPPEVRDAAWAALKEFLQTFVTPDGLVAPGEVVVGAGTSPG